MPSNFKTPQLRQAGRVGVTQTTAPTVDNAARQKAENIGRNIDALSKVVSGGIAAASRFEKTYTAQEKAQNINTAKSQMVAAPTHISDFVRARAQKEEIPFRKLSDEQLASWSKEGANDYLEKKGILDTDSSAEAREMSNDIAVRTQGKIFNAVRKENQEFNADTIANNSSFLAKEIDNRNISKEEYLETLNNNLEIDKTAMGPPTQEQLATADAHGTGRAKQAQFAGTLKAVVETGSPEVLEVLESKEGREYFKDVENYKEMVSMAKNKSIATTNKRKQEAWKAVENSAYQMADAGVFKSKAQVNEFMATSKARTAGTNYALDSKKTFKLKNDLYKIAETEDHVGKYRAALKAGDPTYLQTSGLKKEQIEDIVTKNAMYETGMADFTPASIQEMLIDPKKSEPFFKYLSTGQQLPEQLIAWANTRAVGGFKGAEQKYMDYKQINAGSEGRINRIFNKKSQAEMLFIGNLLDQDIEKSVMQENYIAFQNDTDKNVDSRGNYYSPEATKALDKDRLADISTYSKEAPWTTDALSTPAYVNRQVKAGFALYMNSGLDADAALAKSKQVFEKTHKYVEMPDGTEGVISQKFYDTGLTTKDMVTSAMANKGVKAYIKKVTLSGFRAQQDMAAGKTEVKSGTFKDSRGSMGFLADILIGDEDVTENLSFRPTNQFEKTNEYEVFFRGQRVAGSRFTPTTLTNHKAALTLENEKRIKREDKQRRELRKGQITFDE